MNSLKNIPEHILVISISGIVTESDIASYEKNFFAKLHAHQKICIIVDISQCTDITCDAIIKDIKFEMNILDKLNCIPKIAIISDKQFIKAISTITSFLTPLTEIKNFNSSEINQAIDFASDPTPREVSNTNFEFIKTDSPDIIAYEISGIITKKSIHQVMPKLEKFFDNEQGVNLLAKIPNYSGVSLDVFTMPSLFSMKISAMKHVKRYAIVGAKDWMEKIIDIFRPLVPIEIRTFDLSEEDKAWAWLKS